jgi:hypothetical protein
MQTGREPHDGRVPVRCRRGQRRPCSLHGRLSGDGARSAVGGCEPQDIRNRHLSRPRRVRANVGGWRLSRRSNGGGAEHCRLWHVLRGSRSGGTCHGVRPADERRGCRRQDRHRLARYLRLQQQGGNRRRRRRHCRLDDRQRARRSSRRRDDHRPADSLLELALRRWGGLACRRSLDRLLDRRRSRRRKRRSRFRSGIQRPRPFCTASVAEARSSRAGGERGLRSDGHGYGSGRNERDIDGVSRRCRRRGLVPAGAPDPGSPRSQSADDQLRGTGRQFVWRSFSRPDRRRGSPATRCGRQRHGLRSRRRAPG